jgi:hypothetical protein
VEGRHRIGHLAQQIRVQALGAVAATDLAGMGVEAAYAGE